jgi:hypothetical protein
MADVISGREKNQSDLMDNFKKMVGFINEKFGKDILSPLTITLGDEFQGIMKSLPAAINLLLEMEEYFIHNNLNFKLRYVLNEGDVKTAVNTKIAYEMLGSGLTEARGKLNELKKSRCRFLIELDDVIKSKMLNDSIVFFENILDKWDTGKDYELVSNFIKYKDYKIVSKNTNKNRSLVWKRKKTLNIESYFSIKNLINCISEQR